MSKSDQLSIFIVDDDKMLAKALANELESSFSKFSPTISSFETGESCELAISQRPDIAIVDYNLDSRERDAMNGVAIIDMIKKNSPQTEVIMFTSSENAEIAVKAIQHGAHDYVVKNENVYRKLNMSVLQCYKLKEIKRDMKRQKIMGLLVLTIISFAFGAAMAIQIFAPRVFDKYTQ